MNTIANFVGETAVTHTWNQGPNSTHTQTWNEYQNRLYLSTGGTIEGVTDNTPPSVPTLTVMPQ